MIRVEYYLNQELIEELQTRLLEQLPHRYYSVFPLSKAYGKRGYALGDIVWPETNVCCLLIMPDNAENDVQTLKAINEEMQNSSPQNAITIFAYKVQEI